jgi:hypothetical protein
LGLGVALISVVAAGGPVSANASASALTLRTAAGTLPAGAPITATSTDFRFVVAGGELACDLTALSGTLTTNSAAHDVVSLASGVFSGETEGSPCQTTSGYGPAVVEVLNFPWTVELGANGLVKVKAQRKATFKATFTKGGKQGSCVYETAKVAGGFSTSGPLVLNATGQRFALSKKGSAGPCPKNGMVSGHFAFSSSGETVEAEA